MRKINYITHDCWWNSDLPLFPAIARSFGIEAFVSSSAHYSKHFPTKFSSHVCKIHEYERNYRLKNPLSFIFAINFCIAIKKCIKRDDIIFYVFGDDFYFNLIFLFIFNSSRTVISFHNFAHHSDSPGFEKLFKNIFLKYFKNFHFQSESQFKQFKKGFGSKRAFFTKMPVKDFGTPARKLQLRRQDKMVFLFFGYVRDYKRLDLFIEAANKSVDRAIFVIAGSCDNWKQFSDRIKNQGRFNCNIRFLNNSEIPDFFVQSDFLVLPYTDTTQSGPLQIAINYHIPVIASNLEGFTEVVKDGQNGLIFQKGNEADLVRCINAACAMTQDDYNQMKENQKKLDLESKSNTDRIANSFKEFIDTMDVNIV